MNVLITNMCILYLLVYQDGSVVVHEKAGGIFSMFLAYSIHFQIFIQLSSVIFCYIERWPVMNFKDKEEIKEIEGNYFFEAQKPDNNLQELVETVEQKTDISTNDDESSWSSWLVKFSKDESISNVLFLTITLLCLYNHFFFSFLLL